MIRAKIITPEDKAERLRKYVSTINDLPTIPTIIYDILRSLEDGDMEIDDLVEMVFRDQVLTSRLIKMTNSPLFGRLKEVTNVKHAIVALGINRVRILVFSCSVLNVYPKASDKWVINPAKFWEHSFGCALASEKIAEKIGYKDREKAYLGGLVHDLGELTMSLYFKNQFQQVIHKSRIENSDLHIAEQAVFGVDHCGFGGWLAQKWNFPRYLHEVVACHHTPELAKTDPTLVSIVSLADAICRAGDLGYGVIAAKELVLDTEESWRVLVRSYPKLIASDVQEFLHGISEEIKALVRTIFK